MCYGGYTLNDAALQSHAVKTQYCNELISVDPAVVGTASGLPGTPVAGLEVTPPPLRITTMKAILQRFVLVALLLAPVQIAQSQSQFSVQVFVNEAGKGTLTNSAGFSAALPSSMAPDPGPGGLASALTFDLLNPPGLTSGDVTLSELEESGQVGDLIRFNALSNDSGTLVFYSAFGGGQLADTGSPLGFYENILNLSEVLLPDGGRGAVYTPTEGQPGFVAGAGGPVTYTFESDLTPAPEPASLVLVGTGFVGMAGFIRRKRHA
jgi:hypothetical protein